MESSPGHPIPHNLDCPRIRAGRLRRAALSPAQVTRFEMLFGTFHERVVDRFAELVGGPRRIGRRRSPIRPAAVGGESRANPAS